jgi:putative drug exporter of the RND superfamily
VQRGKTDSAIVVAAHDRWAGFGHWVYRWRWAVVASWTVALLAMLPLAPGVTNALQAGGFSSDDLESARAIEQLRTTFGASPATVLVVFSSPTLETDSPRYQEAVSAALADVRQMPEVAEVTTSADNPLQAASDKHTSYAVVALRTVPEDFRSFLPALRERLNTTELQTSLTGAPVFYADIQEVTERDLQRAELISLPFAALALVIVFGSLVAAAIPGVVGGTAVAVTLGLMVLIAQVTPLSIFSLNLVTMLGLGLGIDYSLFVTSRFREELRARGDVSEAVSVAVATAGRAVLFSGLTVLLGLMALTTFRFMALRSLGLAGSLVVALSVLAALTLLPAILGILGPRVDALAIASLRAQGRGAGATIETAQRRGHVGRPSRTHTFWGRLARAVMAHPWRTLIPTVALLVVLGLPFLRVQFGAPDVTILPQDVESRRAFDLLQSRFGPGELTPILVVLEGDAPPLRAENIPALLSYVRRIEGDPRVVRVDSVLSLDPKVTAEQYALLYRDVSRVSDPFSRAALDRSVRDNTLVVQVAARHGQVDDRTKGLVRQIRATPPPAGMRVLVAGGTAGVVDYADQLYRDFPRALVLVLAATYIVLLLTFRSVLLPLKAIAINTLSLLASYGALVVVFQDGALANTLGIRPLGFVEASLPIVMFCVLFGLSMDYEVFLLSRVREAYLQSGDNAASVALGLERSGGIITSAALIIVLVSGSFVFAEIALIQALGLGTAIAVLLDATVVRALLVPATMRLLGDWNWWAPGWLRGRRRDVPHGPAAVD